jgi:hypothetical protein
LEKTKNLKQSTGNIKQNYKNDILLSGDLNGRIGNAENHNIVGSSGEPSTNTNGLRLRDFVSYNNVEIMNTFYKHKIYIPTHSQLAIPKQLLTISL